MRRGGGVVRGRGVGGGGGDDGAANGILLAKPLVRFRIDPPPHLGRPLVVMTQSNHRRSRHHHRNHLHRRRRGRIHTSPPLPPPVFRRAADLCAVRLPCDQAACSLAAGAQSRESLIGRELFIRDNNYYLSHAACK